MFPWCPPHVRRPAVVDEMSETAGGATVAPGRLYAESISFRKLTVATAPFWMSSQKTLPGRDREVVRQVSDCSGRSDGGFVEAVSVGHGRLGEIANGRFVELQFAEHGFGGRRLWRKLKGRNGSEDPGDERPLSGSEISQTAFRR